MASEDGIEFFVTQGAPPSSIALEQSLAEVKDIYKVKFGYSVNEDSVQGWNRDPRRSRASPAMTVLDKLARSKGPLRRQVGYSMHDDVVDAEDSIEFLVTPEHLPQ